MDGHVYFGQSEVLIEAEREMAEAPQTVAGVDDVVAAYDRLLRVLAGARSPEMLETNVTMAQMKVLLVLMAGEVSMSAMAGQLGVSLSTVSGLVDRLVEAGYAARREDQADRRQVLISLTREGSAFIDRFQELGTRRLRELLGRLGPIGLGQIRESIDLLTAAAERGPLGYEHESLD